ncbi:MAG: phosphoglucosamine mutase [candidate division FCPU426 bacterium]
MKSPVPKLFGTDGIRGLANEGPLEASRVLHLGEVTARVLGRSKLRGPRVGLGWDTRISSPLLAAALSAGLSAGRAEVLRFGVMPTPAVSLLTRHYGLDAGIVISASHNPAEDNGIKYFSSTGGKFPERLERALERGLATTRPQPEASGVRLGAIVDLAGEAAAVYARHLIRRFRSPRWRKLHLVADLAHGATCRTAPTVLAGLGVRAEYLADAPDGLNINRDCGSLHPQAMARAVVRNRAHAGLAFDGDGDRVMLADETGAILNGDRLLGILALHYARSGQLPGRTVVATVMTNLGLEHFLRQHGIRLKRTAVGDRFVAQALARRRWALGGEQSGHLLLPRLEPTGDGLLTALEVLSVLAAGRAPLSQLAAGWKDFPQLLVNVRVSRRPDLASLPAVRPVLDAARRSLADRGRVNLRYSGTENLARVMVEAENADQAETWADRLADAVEQAIGDGRKRIKTWLTCA